MADPGYQVVVARLVNTGEEDLEAKADFNDQYGTLMEIIRGMSFRRIYRRSVDLSESHVQSR